MAVTQTLIGDLRQVVKLERNEPVRQGAGMKDNYVEWVTTRGKLVKYTGSRLLQQGEGVIVNRWDLWIRFQSAVENYIGKSDKLIINNMFFTVVTYELVGERKRMYHFVLSQKL